MKTFAFVFLSTLLISCPHPTPEPGNPGTVHGIIDCATKAVRDHALELIGPVNNCLAAAAAWEVCLVGLINPVVGVTTETVACVVRSSEHAYASSAETNSNDRVSTIARDRARQFLQRHNYVFADAAPGVGPGTAAAGGGK